MNRQKVIALLAASKPIAAKLGRAGLDIELTDEDRSALVGYKRVYFYKKEDPDIYQAAGLNPNDISVLNFVVALQAVKEKEQHKEEEPLE
jgi:hypothetical protein